jgi:ectoine hydroxylase-related dioxygenase (phytanoyl-CoA dioxygenase family)
MTASPSPATFDAETADLNAVADHYVSEGYVVMEGLIDVDRRAAIIGELPRFAKGAYPVANPPPGADALSDAEAVSQILAAHFPHWVSPVVAEAVRDAGLARVLEAITGAHLPYWDGRVKCMQSMLFAKPPGLPGQAWHQDKRYIPTRDRSLVGAWVALDDADEENGCLRVLPAVLDHHLLVRHGPPAATTG